MSPEGLLGALTLVSTVAVKAVGYPDQIRENHRRRSTKGVSRPLYALSFASYVLWTIHGIARQDMVVAVGQGLGVITTALVLVQMALYRREPTA